MDALGGIHDEDGSLNGLERAGDFVGEINVAGSVNQIEFVALPMHLDGGEFNSDALFAFQIHRIQKLGFHFARRNGAGKFHHTVGDGRLAVVNVGDDTKITDVVAGHRDSFV